MGSIVGNVIGGVVGGIFGVDTIVFEESFDTAVSDTIEDPSIVNEAFPSGSVLEWTAIPDTVNTVVFGTAELLFIDNS